MSNELEQMTPNQRRALNKGLAALEAMAAIWSSEIRLTEIVRPIADVPDAAERARRIAAFVEQGFIEGAYRHYLDHKDGILHVDALDAANARIAELEAQAAKKDAKSAEIVKMLSDIIHDHTVAMQSAIIEWKHGKGAEGGLQWIVNTLSGPGHLPDFDAPYGKHPQFWFDANCAVPNPTCFCGNPPHIVWMGQGFCCEEHCDEAKAKHDDAFEQTPQREG